MDRGYFAPVNRQWEQGGLNAVARDWRAFFAALQSKYDMLFP